MQFSNRICRVQPSQTLAVNTRAQEMRALGIKVQSLAAGEPDFPTPAHIREAAKKAIDENFTRYTPVAGIPELRQAAGNYFEKNYGVPVARDSVIIGAGGKNCIFNFIQSMINPGDEVLVPSPYWVSYPDMVLLAGGKPVPVAGSRENSFKVTPLQLEEKTTDHTKLLILNSPCNPTGAVYSDREFMGIMRWALARNIFVLSDEIYDQLVFPPAVMTSAIHWFANCPELVAVANGLSKSYSMTGWRVGFMAAHPDIIRKMTIYQGHSMSNVCSIAQKAALAALEGPAEFIAEMKQAFEERRNISLEMIKTWPGASCPKPDGAFYLFVDMSEYFNERIRNSTELCTHILEEAHVAVVPGSAFGNDKCIRISYAVGKDELISGLEAIGKALSGLK